LLYQSLAAGLQTRHTILPERHDALVSRQELALERLEQTRAVAAYQEAVQMANQRYLGGQANYYELLQEQQQLFSAQTRKLR